jgi:hypothetical protein
MAKTTAQALGATFLSQEATKLKALSRRDYMIVAWQFTARE